MSNLDIPLGDIIKANKKKGGARGGAGRQGGAIAKGSSGNKRQSGGNAKPQTKTATRGGRQQPATQKQNGGGNGNGKQQQPAARKPRQQAKQTPVAAMRAQGRVQSRATTANRSSTGRANQLAARRGQAPLQAQVAAAPAVAAGSQPVLVYQGPNGQQIIQPVALVQQPGQVGAQVIATGAATRTNGAPLFKVANRQQRQQGGGNAGGNGGNRRQSGGNQQQQGGNQRQGGGRRRN